MKKWLITFSGSDYDSTTDALTHAQGVDEVFVYDDVWLDSHPFKKLNAWIFEHKPKRCYGYCSWKPLIILDAMKHLDDGDVVFYVDADCLVRNDLSPVFEYTAEHGAMFFASCGHRQLTWCKDECYAVLDAPMIDEPAGCARFCAFRKGGWKERQFLYEWLTYSVNTAANTKQTRTNRGGFVEHRDEQAIMTLLCSKYGYPLHRECDQTGEDPAFYEMDRNLYPQLFEQVHSTHGINGRGSKFQRVP